MPPTAKKAVTKKDDERASPTTAKRANDNGRLASQPVDTALAARMLGVYRSAQLSLLHDSFQQQLAKQDANKQMNGAIARELASAYVNRRRPIHATPYIADRVVAGPIPEPSEEEVYQAILATTDLKNLQRWKNAGEWKPLTGPARSAAKRESVADEIIRSIFNHFVGGTTAADVAKEQGKELGITYTGKWLKRQGMIQIAAIVSGVAEVYATYELILSALELLIILQKPQRRAQTKAERIAADVYDWLTNEIAMARAAKEPPPKEPPDLQQQLFERMAPPVSTAVRRPLKPH
jgi:hypothetical protein